MPIEAPEIIIKRPELETPVCYGGIWDFERVGIDLKLAVATNTVQLETYRQRMESINGQNPVWELAFFNVVCLIESGEMQVGPFNSESPGSRMVYLAWSADHQKRVQGAPPYSDSSLHMHRSQHKRHKHPVPDGAEWYFNVHGKILVKRGDQLHTVDAQNPTLHVPEYTPHQVKTLQIPSITVLKCPDIHIPL